MTKTATIRETFDAKEAVENALILSPELPSIQIAEQLAKEVLTECGLDATLCAAKGTMRFFSEVLSGHFLRSVRAARLEATRQRHERYRLPGFAHLPLRIQISKTQTKELMEATCWGVARYRARLHRNYALRRPNNPKIREADELHERMIEADKVERGITVRRMLGLEGSQ